MYKSLTSVSLLCLFTFILTMQTQKSDIRKTILQVAKQEFLTLGFKGTAMRSIAKESGMTLSNIYNYFRSKDEIFCEVLNPLLNAFDQIMENHNSDDYITIDVFSMKSYQQKMIDDFMVILKGHRAELKLLLFQASGSSLENFRDTFTDKQTEIGVEYMQLMKKKYPYINNNISTFFIHTMSSWWLTLLGEIVTHDELTENEIEKFLSEYVAFGTAGWKKLMQA